MRRVALTLFVCIAAAAFFCAVAGAQEAGERKISDKDIMNAFKELAKVLERERAERREVEEELAKVRKQLAEVTESLATMQERIERGIKQLLLYGGDFSKHEIEFGLTASPLSEQARTALGLEEGQGVKIKSADSYLEKTGLKKGNALIAINGKPCTCDSENQIKPHPKKLKMLPGDTLLLTVAGKEGKKDISVKLRCAKCGDPASCPLSKSFLPKLAAPGVLKANEASVISALRTLSSAQELYSTRYSTYGTLKKLCEKKMLSEKMASGTYRGYTLKVTVSKRGYSWNVTVRPEKPGQTGGRSFYMGTDGVIRCKPCVKDSDPTADKSSPPYVPRRKKVEKERPANKAANEASAISALRTLSSAQELYNTRFDTYTSLKGLRKRNIIDASLASGQKSGYYYDVVFDGSNSWSATARPVKPGKTGRRSFYIGTDGVIYYRECKKGTDPTAGPGNGKPLGTR